MDGIFNITTLLKENTLAANLLLDNYSKEIFTLSAIESLRNFNESNISCTKELYKSLNEATSKEEENQVFGDFYSKYNSILDRYINEVTTMLHRFTINIDNLVDANLKLANDQEVLSCTKEFQTKVRRYKNLMATKYPRFDPMRIYQKEFDYIGQMMEDLGPIATDIAKLEVLATVSNGFCNKAKNKWLEKCIEDITGKDDCEDLTCYAEILNDIFLDKEETITVNTGTIYAMREEIIGYEKYKDSVTSIGDKLIKDFTYMSENIGSLFYRNKDKVLSIRSKSEDVKDRDYQLNTYAMNQLDIFMKSKVSQVSQMCSLYIIALSVMMDSIIAHITQCGDLLEKVKDEIESLDNTEIKEDPIDNDIPNPDEENIDDEESDIEGGEEGLDDEDEEAGEIMYTDEDDPGNEYDDIPDDSDDNEPEVDNESDDPQEPEPQLPDEDNNISSNESAFDFDREVALFEYAMYAMDNVLEQESMIHYVKKEILNEADNKNDPNATGYSTDDATFIEKIVITLQNIFNKFTNLFQTKTVQRAEFIKNNENAIKSCSLDIGTGFKCTRYENIGKIDELVAKPLRYETMSKDLTSEEDFFKANYPSFAAKLTNGTSIKEAIKLTIIPDPKGPKYQLSNSNIPALVEFCVNFGNNYNDIQKSIKDVKNASAMAKNIAKKFNADNAAKEKSNKTPNTNDNTKTGAQDNKANQAGSANTTPAPNDNNVNASAIMGYSTHLDYLSEDTDIPKSDIKKAESNPLKQVRMYFRVTTTVVSQRMTISQTIFNDYFAILNGALKANGKPSYKGLKEPAKDNENK